MPSDGVDSRDAVFGALAQCPGFFSTLHKEALEAALSDEHWPALEPLNAHWQRRMPASSHVRGFIPQSPEQRFGAAEYEHAIAEHGLIPTRSRSAHDLFNALAWLRWPLSKLALNQSHVEELKANGRQRTRRRDALTLLDESGVVVLSRDRSLLEALSQHRWRQAWWHRRSDWQRDSQCLMLGHGLLEQCQQPYLGLTGKALLVYSPHLDSEGADAWLAEQIATATFRHPHQLSPLPLLGVPGLWPDNVNGAFYDNHDYFRPASSRRPPAPIWNAS